MRYVRFCVSCSEGQQEEESIQWCRTSLVCCGCCSSSLLFSINSKQHAHVRAATGTHIHCAAVWKKPPLLENVAIFLVCEVEPLSPDAELRERCAEQLVEVSLRVAATTLSLYHASMVAFRALDASMMLFWCSESVFLTKSEMRLNWISNDRRSPSDSLLSLVVKVLLMLLYVATRFDTFDLISSMNAAFAVSTTDLSSLESFFWSAMAPVATMLFDTSDVFQSFFCYLDHGSKSKQESSKRRAHQRSNCRFLTFVNVCRHS